MNELVTFTMFDLSLFLLVLLSILTSMLLINSYISGLKKENKRIKKNIKFLNTKRMNNEIDIYKFSTIATVNESKLKQVMLQLDRELFVKHSASCAGSLDIMFVSFLEKSSVEDIEKLITQYDDGKHSVLIAILETFRGKKTYKEFISKEEDKLTKKAANKVTKKKTTRRTKKKATSK